MKYFFTILFMMVVTFPKAQVTINVTSVPANTPTNDNIYIAGTFNGWDPGNASYRLTKINSVYTITLASGTGTIEFKFTRGDWSKGECNADGSYAANRTFSYGNGDTLNLSIAGWDDFFGHNTKHSTALPNVSVMDPAFYMPQLNRSRKIWIYLPDDYAAATSKHYPVIYMHDGQNLFDDSTSYAGEWKIDETLHSLQMSGDYGAIVIGVENGGAYRLDEYSPYHNPQYGGGQGDEYVDFIVNTLKPYVDAHYRTLTTRDYTAIAGSSMGGLISFYAGEKYPDVFSKIGVFSPSLWFNDSIFTYASQHPHSSAEKYYFVAGRSESADMVPDIKRMYDTLTHAGFSGSELDTVIKTDGQHAEWFWAREFPSCYEWLFANALQGINDPQSSEISIYPNPASNQIFLKSKDCFKTIRFQIIDAQGRVVKDSTQKFSKAIDVSSLQNGWYHIKVIDGSKQYVAPVEIIRQ